MPDFPVFESLRVDGYLLYPGREVEDSIDAAEATADSDHFALQTGSGPWVILGVNGLGKSTLLLLIKHVMIGAVRARDAGFTGERSDIVTLDSRFFAVRVSDGARSATAELCIRIGDAKFRVRRKLSDLSYVAGEMALDEVMTELPTEEHWRAAITQEMGLNRFEDAVRVIDRIVFFLEQRSPLIWDVSAQFELFRALLTPENSAELRRLEAEIVSNDSAARNLNATIYKLTQRRDRQIRLIESSANTHAQIAAATARRDAARAEEARLQASLDGCEIRRSDGRLVLRRAERDADSAAGTYEQIKFRLLRHAFAGIPPNEQYVFLKILSDKVCLACGNDAHGAAEELERRKDSGLCLVCGSPRMSDPDIVTTAEGLQTRAVRAFRSLEVARTEVGRLAQSLRAVEEERESLVAALETVRENVDREEALLRKLHRQLPADDRLTLSREEDRIESLRRDVLQFRADRDAAEEEIAGLLETLSNATVQIRLGLEDAFLQLSRDFFAEHVRLVYAPRRDRIGQGGRFFEFPSFEVEMTSGATQGEFVRRTQEQVSLSQREYLDIIFRMSLLLTLSEHGCSMVVDGPEGSLDAVFATRAGDLFAKFAEVESRNVILACNIIEGGFLPNTLKHYDNAEFRKSRVINLLENAAPTAALRELRGAYRTAVAEILNTEARAL